MNGHVPRKALKTSFRASPRSIRPIYTGGPVLLTKDGRWLISTMGEEVMVTEVTTGLAVARVRGDGSAITSLALSYHTSPPTLVTCHMSMTIRFYPLPDSLPIGPGTPSLTYTRQNTRAHSAPILVSVASPDSTLIATGSSDGIVKVWDAEGGYVTHMFRGHGGPVSALKFHFGGPNDVSKMELWTGSTDGRVRVFDLRETAAAAAATGRGGASGSSASKAQHVLEGHVSVVRGIDISEDGRWAITGGRDKVVLVWDLLSGEGKKGKGKGPAHSPRVVQTLVCQEQVETLGLLPSGIPVLGQQTERLRCWTGGEKGTITVWDVLKGEEVGSMQGVEGVDEAEPDEDEQRGIISSLYDESSACLVSVHADQNIIYHSVSTGAPARQIVGFNDEVVDAAFLSHEGGPSHSHIALATNSNLIRLYSTSSFDTRLLSGHKDMVLCLDRSPDYRWLVSGSKDHSARIWAPVASSSSSSGEGSASADWRCIALLEGHAESIGAVALSRKVDDRGRSGRFVVTASQDRTVKLWDLTSLSLDSDGSSVGQPKSLATLRAHEKDINSLDLSPNDKFLASGSQDKLVKIFEVDFTMPKASEGASGALKLVGTMKGHRRGVWTVRFSRTDRVVASGAADRTVKFWSLDDYTCLKTFEGHTNSVLRVDFLTNGMQLVTSASDGLVKLWNIKDEQCVKTLDNHEDKIWALTVSADEKTIVSAGADSIATIWEDSTEVEQAEKNEALIKAVQSEQDFTNYVALKDYRRAIQLALSMSQPGRLLSLFNTLNAARTAETTAYTGSPEVDLVISTLPAIDLVRLLRFVRDWNANARTSGVAQMVLHAIMRLRSAEDVMNAFESATRVPVAAEGDDDAEGDGAKSENGDEASSGADNKKRRKKGETVMSMREFLDGMIPYSERHFNRIDKLVQDSYMLDYVVGEMDGGILGGEVMDVDA